MGDKNKEILQEMVNIELNMQDLYLMYQAHFSEDAVFWGTIAEEEATHSSIISLAIDVLDPDMFEKIFTYDDLDQLKKANELIKSYGNSFEENAPAKEDAYRFAMDLERKGFEAFYEGKMRATPESEKMEIFQKMNEDCKGHAARIERLLNETT